MTSMDGMARLFDAITINSARAMGLSGYGLDVGCNGDLVVLQARDPVEAIRQKATRLTVVKRGKVIAETAPKIARLALEGSPERSTGRPMHRR